MHLILLVVGVALAVAGGAMMPLATPFEEVGPAALFTSGMVAAVGGLILIGIAAAVRNLNRIAERLEIQPLPLPPIATVGREDPGPRPVRTAPAGAARTSLFGWFGRAGAPPPLAARTQSGPAPQSEVPVMPPVDLAPLTRIPETPREAQPFGAAAPPARPAPRPAPPPKATPNDAAASTVYRSGVIDGMAYSLFMDGSIQAELPQGTVKFASVDELQKYLLGNKA